MTETAKDTYLLSVDLCYGSSVGKFLEVVMRKKETRDHRVSVTFHLASYCFFTLYSLKEKKKKHLLGTID